MRKLIPFFALLAIFAVSMGFGMVTATPAQAIPSPGPDCWAYCAGDDLIMCCDFPTHGVLCWVQGPCPF